MVSHCELTERDLGDKLTLMTEILKPEEQARVLIDQQLTRSSAEHSIRHYLEEALLD